MNTNTQKVRVMADIETLGTTPGSVILSIGAVKFDRHGVYDTFYRIIIPKSCMDVGLKVDIDTVFWWLGQSPEAQQALLMEPKHSLPAALMSFTNWLVHPHEVNPPEVELWGNGANFDNVLLAAAYDACQLVRPWKHYNDRCYRTFKAIHPEMKIERTGTHHNALDDAISQAKHLISLPTFQALCDSEEAVS